MTAAKQGVKCPLLVQLRKLPQLNMSQQLLVRVITAMVELKIMSHIIMENLRQGMYSLFCLESV